MSPPDLVDRLRAICAGVGFDLDHVESNVLERFEVLAQTQTVADVERMAAWALAVFEHYDATKPDVTFSEAERRVVVLGCLFSDIGKTGPACADHRGQQLVVDMFSVEGVRDDKQPVRRFFETYFPGDAGARAARFAALGLDPEMPMRQFWNLHATWTLEIVQRAGVPLEAVAAAASHHILEDVNPGAIVGTDRRYTRAFGENVAFDRAEKLVVVLDKYDAVRRRGNMSHHQAIAWLRRRVESNPSFRGDAELETLIADLDAVGLSRDFVVARSSPPPRMTPRDG